MAIALHKNVWMKLGHGSGKVLLLGLMILAAWLAPHQLLAQERPIAFKHLTIDDGLSQSLIYAILQDRKRYMWFGTQDGLNRYDGYRFTVFKNDAFDSTSISGNEVTALYEDRAGNLWIAAGMLNRFDPATTSFRYFRNDPKDRASLSFNTISTNKGISQLLLAGESSTPRFKNYDVSDGLQSNEFNRAGFGMCRRGEMFFGGINGLNAFFPTEIKDNPHAPPVVFTDFQLFYKSTSWRDENSPLLQAIATAPAITSPVNNQNFTVGDTVLIAASIAASNNALSVIEFFADTQKLGEDASAPSFFCFFVLFVSWQALLSRVLFVY